MDEAKQSGDATKNSNYKTRPQEMLIARCTSRLCSMIFPDVTGGFSSAVNVPLDQGDDEPVAEKSTVTVRQEPKKTPPRRKAKAESQPEPAQQESTEPPLPGEDGYEDLGEDKPAAPSPEIPTEDPDDAILDAETVEEPPLTATQSGLITALIKTVGFGKTEGLAFYSATVGRPIKATRDLTTGEAATVIAALQDLTDGNN
jgi:hypothetical protein